MKKLRWKFCWSNLSLVSTLILPISAVSAQHNLNVNQKREINTYKLNLQNYQLDNLNYQKVKAGQALLPLGQVTKEEITNLGINLPKLDDNLFQKFEIVEIDQQVQEEVLKITTKANLVAQEKVNFLKLTNFANPLERQVLAFENYHPQLSLANNQDLILPGPKNLADFNSLNEDLPLIEGVQSNFYISKNDINYQEKMITVQANLFHPQFGKAQTTFAINFELAKLNNLRSVGGQFRADQALVFLHTKLTNIVRGDDEDKMPAGYRHVSNVETYAREKVYLTDGSPKHYEYSIYPGRLSNDLIDLQKDLGIDFTGNYTELFTDHDQSYPPQTYDPSHDYIRLYFDFFKVDTYNGQVYTEVGLRYSYYEGLGDWVGDYFANDPGSDTSIIKFYTVSDFDKALEEDYDAFESTYTVHEDAEEAEKPEWPNWTPSETKTYEEAVIERELGIHLPEPTNQPNGEKVERTYKLTNYDIWNGEAKFEVTSKLVGSIPDHTEIKTRTQSFTVHYFKGQSQLDAETDVEQFNNYQTTITTEDGIPPIPPKPGENVTSKIKNWDLTPNLPEKKGNVSREYTVDSVNDSQGIVNIQVTTTKNAAIASKVFPISGFWTINDNFVAAAFNTLNNKTFTLQDQYRMEVWPKSLSSVQIEEKFQAQMFTIPFPRFNSVVTTEYSIISQTTDTGTSPGYLTIKVEIDAENAHPLTATFKVANFWNDNEETIYFDLDKITNYLDNKFDLFLKNPVSLPKVGDQIGYGNRDDSKGEGMEKYTWEGDIYYNYEFTDAAKSFPRQPTVTNNIEQTYVVTEVDDEIGKIKVKITSSKNGNSDYLFVTIAGFKTRYDELLAKTVDDFNNQTFTLSEKQNLWEPQNADELANLLAQAKFTSAFPNPGSSVVLTYEIKAVDLDNGAMTINVKINVSNKAQGSATFTVTNFKTIADLAFEEATDAFEDYQAALEESEMYPNMGQDISELIHTWKLDHPLPEKPEYHYVYTVKNVNQINHTIEVTVQIIWNDQKAEKTFVISNFEKPISLEIQKAFEQLNGKNFNLPDIENLNVKESIWENLDSDQITNKIESANFKEEFPNFLQTLVIKYEIWEANWNTGVLKLQAEISFPGEDPLIAEFTISNFKTNNDIIQLAFNEAKLALKNTRLKSENKKNSILIGFQDANYYFEFPEPITYTTRSQDGKTEFTHQIKWEAETIANAESNKVNVKIKLFSHLGQEEGLILTFDKQATINTNMIILIVVISLSVLIILGGLIVLKLKKNRK